MRAVWAAVLAVFASGMAFGFAFAQTVPETECDRMAGLWLMPRAEGLAQSYAIDDAAAAVEACAQARAEHPAEPFFALLLARALITLDPSDSRAMTEVMAVETQLPALSAAQLGSFYEYGLAGLPAAERPARDFYRRACDERPAPQARPGCAGLAVMMIEGRGGPVDETGGFNMLQSLCNAGWAVACTDLSLFQELYGTASAEQVTALLVQACEAGDLFGCSLLGFRHETEQGAPYDMTRARALYDLACQGGEMHGCGNLGEVYRSGLGVAPDIPLAVTLFAQACAGDDSYSCAALGDILANGRGVTADVPRALVAFDHACWLGDPEACYQADVLR